MRSFWRMFRSFCTKSCKARLVRLAISVAVVGNMGATLWIMISERNMPEYFNPDIHTSAKLKSHRRCFIPTLNPFEPEIKQLMNKPTPIDCSKAANPNFGRIAFEGRKGVHSNLLVQKLDVGAPCCYRPFYRVSDDEVWLEPTANFTYVCHPIKERETSIPSEYEFIEVLCGLQGSAYKDGFAFVSRKATVEKRILLREKKRAMKKGGRYKSSKRRKEAHRISVIIIGLDSTSQMNFIRMMPKSHRYLVNTLSAVPLKGYNKVGENTLPNVVPLLTGLHLSRLKDLCINKDEAAGNSAIHLDKCPFIWKNFSARGYRTSFAEDEVSTGVFNLHWSHAFESPPTDHYFRTFSIRMQQNHASFGSHCHGTRMTFEILMEYIRNTAATYKNDRYFQFVWASKLSHDDFNRLAWGDSHLLATLKFLNVNGHLNESVLIVIGDHGSRNEYVRKTHQGQMEDRLPVAYIRLPQWFHSEYPLAWQNLQENSERLTTAFDIHETLKDMLDLSQLADPNTHYERRANKRYRILHGSSLFMKIPETRGCIAAGIPQHWCICYKKRPILTESSVVKSAARFAIRSFNQILKPYQRICEPLRLFQVTRALQWKPDDFESTDKGDASPGEEEEYKKSSMIQVSFTVLPGHASFEITLVNHPEYGFKLTDEIVRLNRYEGRGDCIHQELKILCQCKKMGVGGNGGSGSGRQNKKG